jgi:hypothetical protein
LLFWLRSSSQFTYSKQTPAISLQGEYGLRELGPGVLGIGAYIGRKTYSYDYNDYSGYTWSEKWAYTIVGLRAAWHYTELDVDNLDLYGGAMLSYNNVSYSFTSTAPANYYGAFSSSSASSGVGITGFVGARYYFTPKLGAFAELGYGISYATIGLTLRLK